MDAPAPGVHHGSMRTAPALGLIGFVLATSGCQRVALPPPAPLHAVEACPTPDVDTRGWQLVTDSAGVRYRLPPGFTEGPRGDPPYRRFTWAGEPSGQVTIGFSPSREHYASMLRVPAPPMKEMTECQEAVHGRDVFFQAWRMEGGSFRNGRRYDNFEIHALVPVQPMLTLFVTGGSEDPAFQAVMLAIARTVEVSPR
jgi:hypothetical protein